MTTPMIASVSYHDVPAEVAHVSAYQWRPGSRPSPLPLSLAKRGADFTITLDSGSGAVFVRLQRLDGSYLLDGPFTPDQPAIERRLDAAWRRTIEGHGVGDQPVGAGLEWLPASGAPSGPWPACWAKAPAAWECVGVPIDESGVVAVGDGARVFSAAANGASTPVLRASGWGRLMIVSDRGTDPPPRLRIAAARPVDPPTRRPGVRLATVAVADVRVVPVGPGAIWLTGDSSPAAAWIEVRSARSGPRYLALAEVAAGPYRIPVHVALEDAHAVDAIVLTAGEERAAAALATVFRLIDPPPAPRARGGAPPPRRVLIAETVADSDGAFRLDGLGEADYEIVAWHPQFGRASLLLPAGADRVTIHLQSPGIARGRVLAGGKPAAGVDVIGLPDPAAFASASDPLDVKGGDARTGADGRFSLALAPGGGGELRVGGGAYAVRRVPLPRAPLPLVDLGDIELGRPVTLAVVLDRDPGCDLRATGPIGRSGLQIVIGSRVGPGIFSLVVPEEGSWEVGLICGKEERELAPSIATISAGRGVQELRAVVR
jgi:hypothetical protein